MSIKLMTDLTTLSDRITLCNEMLLVTPSSNSTSLSSEDNEEDIKTLLSVIGYLEACKTRMTELIEVGMNGGLDEEVFMRVLEVNDFLVGCLEGEATGKPPTTAPSTNASGSNALTNYASSSSAADDPFASPSDNSDLLDFTDNSSSDTGKSSGLKDDSILAPYIAPPINNNAEEDDPFTTLSTRRKSQDIDDSDDPFTISDSTSQSNEVDDFDIFSVKPPIIPITTPKKLKPRPTPAPLVPTPSQQILINGQKAGQVIDVVTSINSGKDTINKSESGDAFDDFVSGRGKGE